MPPSCRGTPVDGSLRVSPADRSREDEQKKLIDALKAKAKQNEAIAAQDLLRLAPLRIEAERLILRLACEASATERRAPPGEPVAVGDPYGAVILLSATTPRKHRWFFGVGDQARVPDSGRNRGALGPGLSRRPLFAAR